MPDRITRRGLFMSASHLVAAVVMGGAVVRNANGASRQAVRNGTVASVVAMAAPPHVNLYAGLAKA